jgi:hypothetical protein
VRGLGTLLVSRLRFALVLFDALASAAHRNLLNVIILGAAAVAGSMPGAAKGPLEVPGPVPIVSPVVPLFRAPLLIPDPWLGRLIGAALIELPVGETAESPDVVVTPVLAFCASTEFVITSAEIIAISVIFISILAIKVCNRGNSISCGQFQYARNELPQIALNP